MLKVPRAVKQKLWISAVLSEAKADTYRKHHYRPIGIKPKYDLHELV
jgi:hypothetical protein